MTYKEQMDKAILRTIRKAQKDRGLGRWPAAPLPDRREKAFNAMRFDALVRAQGAGVLNDILNGWQIQDYRTGLKHPSQKLLRKVCKALGVPVSHLVTPIIDDWEE